MCINNNNKADILGCFAHAFCCGRSGSSKKKNIKTRYLESCPWCVCVCVCMGCKSHATDLLFSEGRKTKIFCVCVRVTIYFLNNMTGYFFIFFFFYVKRNCAVSNFLREIIIIIMRKKNRRFHWSKMSWSDIFYISVLVPRDEGKGGFFLISRVGPIRGWNAVPGLRKICVLCADEYEEIHLRRLRKSRPWPLRHDSRRLFFFYFLTYNFLKTHFVVR